VSAPVSQAARELAANRSKAPHTSMMLRMLLRAAELRRGRALSALLAMVVAAAVATAMLNLFVDVQAKLQREFRNYGANIVLVGKDGASLPGDALAQVDSVLAGRGTAAPFGLIVARTASGQPLVVAGADFGRTRQLDSWWKVSTWPAEIPTLRQAQGRLFGANNAPEMEPGAGWCCCSRRVMLTASAREHRIVMSRSGWGTLHSTAPSFNG